MKVNSIAPDAGAHQLGHYLHYSRGRRETMKTKNMSIMHAYKETKKMIERAAMAVA